MNRITLDWLPLQRADTAPLLKAIVLVQEKYHSEGKKPGSEHWVSDSRHYRPQMINDVWARWKEITGDDGVFPWHDDFVCDTWVKFRKCNDLQKGDLKKSLGISQSEAA